MNTDPDRAMSKIPATTIELFSWEYLKAHPKMQPLIKKYFGEIGAVLFAGFERLIPGQSKSWAELNEEYAVAKDFVQEVNQIPAKTLLDKIVYPKTPEEAEQFFYDRPYYFLFQENFAKLDLACMIMARKTYVDTNEPAIWQDAIIYLRFLNKEFYNLDDERIEAGKKALDSYIAKYAIEKLGIKGIKNLFSEFLDFDRFEEHVGKFDEFLNKALNNENIYEKFFNPHEAKIIQLADLDNYDKLFEYPCRIEFSSEANDEIIRRILHDEMTSTQIDLYLGTEHKTTELYKLYPVLKYILKTTNDDHLFWTAGDMLAIIWRLLPDDNKLEKWFDKELYDIFWSRVETVERVRSYEKLILAENERRIFEDALEWIINIPELKQLDPELWNYVAKPAKGEKLFHFSIILWKMRGRISTIRCEDLPAIDRYKLLRKHFCNDDFFAIFNRPTTIQEAKDYLEIMLNLKTELYLDEQSTFEAIKVLLLECHSPEIQNYIYKYLIDNFEHVCETTSLRMLPLQNNTPLKLIEATCDGATAHTKLRQILISKCLDLMAEDERQTYHKQIDDIIKRTERNISYRQLQGKLLAQHLRQYSKETEKQTN